MSGKMKPKANRKKIKSENNLIDRCLTPWYGVEPLLPYIPVDSWIWESACGEDYIGQYLREQGFNVLSTDLERGFDFFASEHQITDVQITNPPYSIKYEWIKHSYELGKPFALLVPVETIGSSTGQNLAKQYGAEFMFLDKRIDFYMPHKGWDGTAQFPVMWWCWRLLDTPIVYANLNKPLKTDIKMYYEV